MEKVEMPYSWCFLEQFNFSNPPTSAFCRKDSVEEKYIKHGSEIKKAGGVETYLKKKYLQDGVDYTMTLNNFPYDMEDGINHYVIWFQLDRFSDFNNPGEVKKIIKKYEQDSGVEFQDTVFFQNIERLRSVPGIPHIHVFARINT